MKHPSSSLSMHSVTTLLCLLAIVASNKYICLAKRIGESNSVKLVNKQKSNEEELSAKDHVKNNENNEKELSFYHRALQYFYLQVNLPQAGAVTLESANPIIPIDIGEPSSWVDLSSFPNIAFNFPSISICFSSENEVSVMSSLTEGEVMNKKMKDVQVGDLVLTSSGKYEPIYSIDHRHPTRPSKFVQIHYAATGLDKEKEEYNTPLEVSDRHMVFLQGRANPVPAATIEVGDQLRTLGQRKVVVTKIESITRKGLFNPLTPDGTIVINKDSGAIVASTYSALLFDMKTKENSEYVVGDNKDALFSNMSHQSLVHNLLQPYRSFCTGISMELCRTSNEFVSYTYLGNLLVQGYESLGGQPFQHMLLVAFITAINLLSMIAKMIKYGGFILGVIAALAMYNRLNNPKRSKEHSL